MSRPDTDRRALDYDVIVVGAGVAGMETAASIGDIGYRVLLVDKNARSTAGPSRSARSSRPSTAPSAS